MEIDPRVKQLIEKLHLREQQLKEAQTFIAQMQNQYAEEVEKFRAEYEGRISKAQRALTSANAELRAFRQRDDELNNVLEGHFTLLPAPK